MNHTVSPMVPLGLAAAHESQLFLSAHGQETIAAEPNTSLTSRVLKKALGLGLPFLTSAALITGCSSNGETMDTSSESVPVLTTTTTESVPTIEPVATTVLETTTTVKVDPREVAACHEAHDKQALPGGWLDIIGAPNIDKMKFFVIAGDCEKVGKDGIYYWGYPGAPGDKYVIDAEPPGLVYGADGKVYSPYDTKGNHYRELLAGDAAIPQKVWDAPHPAFPKAVTLRQLAEMQPGTTICFRVGLNNKAGLDERYTYQRLELRTHFDKDTMTEEYTVLVVFLHPNGTTVGKWPTEGMGLMPDAKTGAWIYASVEEC